MLIARDLSKRNTGDSTAWDLLEIEAASPTGENLYLVSTCPYQMNRSPSDKDLVLINSWTNKHLVMLPRIEECRARSDV
jgi:hypothetical protein